MYQNPYALKPGEVLTPQQLFERHIDWSNHARSIEAWKETESCDRDLYSSWLCCEDHVRYQSEMDHFLHYFLHHFMLMPGELGFSMPSMVAMINNLKLKINQELKEKLRLYWGRPADRFFKALGI